MYTLQALWSQRGRGPTSSHHLPNRRYAILTGELMAVGANPGRKALDMISLEEPALDW